MIREGQPVTPVDVAGEQRVRFPVGAGTTKGQGVAKRIIWF